MKFRKFSTYAAIVAFAAAAPVYARAAQANATIVAAITQMENDSVKADLAGDKSWFEQNLAEDWMGCDSGGKWFTKADTLKMMADPKNNSFKSEKLSNMKVRVYGPTAIATYTDTYEATINGEHRVRTVLSTDVFAKTGAAWKLVSGHSTPTK